MSVEIEKEIKLKRGGQRMVVFHNGVEKCATRRHFMSSTKEVNDGSGRRSLGVKTIQLRNLPDN